MIVSSENIILSIGYNGFPRGCADENLPWAKKSRSGDVLDTKYPYVRRRGLGRGRCARQGSASTACEGGAQGAPSRPT